MKKEALRKIIREEVHNLLKESMEEIKPKFDEIHKLVDALPEYGAHKRKLKDALLAWQGALAHNYAFKSYFATNESTEE